MNSTVDTSAALAPAAARFDKQHAGARQQRWMAELEQAMLAQQPGQRPADSAPPSQEQDDAVQAGASAVAVATPADAARHGGTSAYAAQPAAARATGPDAPSNAQAAAAMADQTEAPDGELALHGGPAGAPGVSRQQAVVDAGVAVPASTLSAAPVVMAYGGIAAIAMAQAAAESTPPVVAAGQATARAGLGLGLGLDGAAAQNGGEAEELAQDAAHAAPDAAEGEEYSKNLLHLFHGEDGVQAYIRDAELTGAQMRAVAQALAAELGGSGTRLAALTVNGRRLPLGNAAPYEQHDEASTLTDHAVIAPYRSSIEQKENT